MNSSHEVKGLHPSEMAHGSRLRRFNKDSVTELNKQVSRSSNMTVLKMRLQPGTSASACSAVLCHWMVLNGGRETF